MPHNVYMIQKYIELLVDNEFASAGHLATKDKRHIRDQISYCIIAASSLHHRHHVNFMTELIHCLDHIWKLILHTQSVAFRMQGSQRCETRIRDQRRSCIRDQCNGPQSDTLRQPKKAFFSVAQVTLAGGEEGYSEERKKISKHRVTKCHTCWMLANMDQELAESPKETGWGWWGLFVLLLLWWVLQNWSPRFKRTSATCTYPRQTQKPLACFDQNTFPSKLTQHLARHKTSTSCCPSRSFRMMLWLAFSLKSFVANKLTQYE